MIILFRKANGTLQRTTDLYEWQPTESSNGRWYTIHRRNVTTGTPTLEKSPYVRQLFIATLNGLICRVHARYRRHTKTLELEVMKQ